MAGKGQPVRAEPASDPDRVTLADLGNEYLNAKRRRMESDEISARTFEDCYATCSQLIDNFGTNRRVEDLRPADFEKFRTLLAKRHALGNLKNVINRFRGVFRYAEKDQKRKIKINYGDSFDRPSAKSIRKARYKSRREDGIRLLEADEIRTILDNCDASIRAMTLLGINCGFGNTDCAILPQHAIDFESGWIDFPREKTAIDRRVPLWPETLDALRTAIAAHPTAKNQNDADMTFLTHHGARCVRTQKQKTKNQFVTIDALSQKFAKLLKRLEINGRRWWIGRTG